ncbi:MAG: undecaprenyl-phosphate galactose phosphotransferase WbaP [Elusimicrobia bacterium]|nr:undecaprenyl-phosphate galactose phosphotransferase WbaP [Elusimicrobiota bacterium]
MTLQSHLTPTKLKNRLGILALFGLDFAALFLIFHAAILLRKTVLPRFFSNLPEYHYQLGGYWWIFAVWLLIMLYEEGYSRRFARWDEVKFIWKSAFFSTIAILTMLFLMKRGQEYSRLLVGTMFILAITLFPLIRLRAKKLLYAAGLMRRKILIIGSGEAACSAYSAITHEPNLGYEVAGFIDDHPSAPEIDCHKVHLGIGKIERYIKSADIHDVIVAKPELPKEPLVKLINTIQHKAENTLYIPDISGIAVSGTELRHFFKEQTMVIEIKNNLFRPLNYLTKRAVDYLAGLLVFAVSIPALLLIARLIKKDSPGPAMLRQERIGKNGRLFLCYKFRTMHTNAEERLNAILAADPGAREEWEKYWKLKDDPRITKVGRWLRASSLDELPQVINILKGEMSLIGPRPYLPREKEFLAGEGPTILKLPPGITGLWQVSGRSDTSYDSRLDMDAWYVKNWDLWLDIMIIFKTAGVVLKKEGAR